MCSYVGLSDSLDMTGGVDPPSETALVSVSDRSGNGFKCDTSAEASTATIKLQSSGDSSAKVEQSEPDTAPAAMPSPLLTSVPRYRLQRQQGTSEMSGGTFSCPSTPRKMSAQSLDKGSLTPGMRKKYLKELLSTRTGLGSIFLSSENAQSSELARERTQSASDEIPNTRAFWALDPTEHAWMLSVVDANLDGIVGYLKIDSSLLTKRDFVTGFTVLHWLSKYGKHVTLLRLLKYAEKEGLSVDVNIKASGGFTPLHVAAMHGQYMVIKILVGAFCANVDAMDYNGRRAWQYLRSDASSQIRDLLGAIEDEQNRGLGHRNVNNNSVPAALHLHEVAVQGDSRASRNRLRRIVRRFIASLRCWEY
ncbi:hypothetical protein GJAV_G00125360 [Gymnothorax javanicus]|nr:hypothetical protein GJAV_G00125360 [Gymnothorax javanicus]